MTRASSSSSPAKSPAPAADVFGVVTGRAGRGAPSLDHAEPHSAWPLEPATRCWLVALRGYPEDTGPGRALPSPPAPPRQRLCKADNSDVRKIHSLISVLISSKFTYQDVPGGAGGRLPRPVSSGEILRSAKPPSRGGLEWPRRLRLSVVWGGDPQPRRAIVGTESCDAARVRKARTERECPRVEGRRRRRARRRLSGSSRRGRPARPLP